MHETNPPSFQEYFLRPGYIYISRVPTLVSTVLGSCVAVVLWDKKQELGGMNHFLYPVTRDAREATPQFGNVGVKALLRFFLEEGSRKGDLEAQVFGGAHPEGGDHEVMEIGRCNVDVGRQVLLRNGIPIVSEDVGGTKGRKVVYNTKTNEVAVFRVDRLRDSDWYPYREGR